MTGRRPAPADLRRGGIYGHHVRPSQADDITIQALVEAVFAPAAPWQAEDPLLVRQLLDHAPQPGRVGIDDHARQLRADEVADLWGVPLEGPDIRRSWLLRADEVARAWGRPLAGPDGLAPELTLP